MIAKASGLVNLSALTSAAEFEGRFAALGYSFPASEDLSVLAAPVKAGGITLPNAIAVQPCEGFDAEPDGAPSELTRSRYRRLARSGAGLLWFESCAIAPGLRSNPRQLVISRENAGELERLLRETKSAAPAQIRAAVQLSHAGRDRIDADGRPSPLPGSFTPFFDGPRKDAVKIASDAEVELAVGLFIEAAALCAEIGFDFVDIKLCHQYFLRDLLCGFTRPGPYGGSFENRTRAVLEIIGGAGLRIGSSELCVRINAYDAIAYPYGWGMVQEYGVMAPDPSEPARLIKLLSERGVGLVNVSAMEPRYAPYGEGMGVLRRENPAVDPYAGLQSLLESAARLKSEAPEVKFAVSGLSWPGRFGPNVAAAGIKAGNFDLAGFGRQALAYPRFALDVLENGALKPEKTCLLCDKCHELMSAGGPAGCVARGPEIYAKTYREKLDKRLIEGGAAND